MVGSQFVLRLLSSSSAAALEDGVPEVKMSGEATVTVDWPDPEKLKKVRASSAELDED